MKTLHAVYDGSVLLPDEPLRLDPNTRVRITVEAVGEPPSPAVSSGYRGQELDWIQSHGEELAVHRGKWVVLEGETIVASDADYDLARKVAKGGTR